MGKPFFFRIEAAALIDFATDPDGQGFTLLQFAKELQKGQSDIVFIQNIIEEACNYIEKKRKAGSSGGLAKASSAKAVLKQCHSSALAKPSTPLASSSNRKDKRCIPKKDYAENVSMTETEYQKIVEDYGQEKTDWMVRKLDNAKGARGLKYKSDYRAILKWVVDCADKEFKPKESDWRNTYLAGY